MREQEDLGLGGPLVALQQTLAAVDLIAATDIEQRDRIAAGLCHLQFAIDLLNEAHMADAQPPVAECHAIEHLYNSVEP